jgi:antirestriction protein
MEQTNHHEGGDVHPNNEHHEWTRQPTPSIWVGSLADYNAGVLYGEWIDATAELEDIETAISAMVAASPTPGAEEWGIFDSEGFGPLSIDEYESLATVHRLARGIGEHGTAFAHYAALVGTRDPDELDRFEDAYMGRYDSVEDYAEDLLDDLGYVEIVERSVPESMAPYIHLDIEGFARDLELSGAIATAQDTEGTYVFDLER